MYSTALFCEKGAQTMSAPLSSGGTYISVRLRSTKTQTVSVTELKKVVATTVLEVRVPSWPIFLAMI